jgi:hypothetical protein
MVEPDQTSTTPQDAAPGQQSPELSPEDLHLVEQINALPSHRRRFIRCMIID